MGNFIGDKLRRVSLWLFYNWDTKEVKVLPWKEGFGVEVPEGMKEYFIGVELSRDVQFPKDVPEEGSRVTELGYKTPAFAREARLDDALDHLAGRIARVIEHILPPGTYGPGRPLQAKYSDGHVCMYLPDGHVINIDVKVTKPGATKEVDGGGVEPPTSQGAQPKPACP